MLAPQLTVFNTRTQHLLAACSPPPPRVRSHSAVSSIVIEDVRGIHRFHSALSNHERILGVIRRAERDVGLGRQHCVLRRSQLLCGGQGRVWQVVRFHRIRPATRLLCIVCALELRLCTMAFTVIEIEVCCIYMPLTVDDSLPDVTSVYLTMASRDAMVTSRDAPTPFVVYLTDS